LFRLHTKERVLTRLRCPPCLVLLFALQTGKESWPESLPSTAAADCHQSLPDALETLRTD
jgi:hypothetical protein